MDLTYELTVFCKCDLRQIQIKVKDYLVNKTRLLGGTVLLRVEIAVFLHSQVVTVVQVISWIDQTPCELY